MSTKAERKKSQKDKFYRYKMMAIPLLLCVLAYIVFGPSSDPGALPPSSESTSRIVPSPPELSSAIHASAIGDSSKTSRWPEVDVSFLAGPNPFASYLSKDRVKAPELAIRNNGVQNDTGAQSVPSQVDSLANVTRELIDQPVNYIFQSNGRKLVMLGEQILEKGTRLSESVHVQDIEGDALILAVRNGVPSATHPQSQKDEIQ